MTAAGRPPVADRLGESYRELGLARRGRAREDDEWRCPGHAPTSAPRKAYGPAWSMRTRTSRPTSASSPARWTSLLPRVRPDSRLPSPAHRGIVGIVVVTAGRVDRVDEDLDLAPQPRLIALEPDPLLEREEVVEAAALDVGRDVVGELRRRRPGARRVGRGEDLVVADGLEKGESLLELRLGLAAEADDDVGRDGDAGDGLADPVEPLLVVLDGVLAAHPVEDGVRARLDRQVEVLADGAALGQRRDQPVRQVPRVRGDEPQAPDGVAAIGGPQRVDGADELGQVGAPGEVEPAARPALGIHVGEARFGPEVMAVRVDVLAEQRDLAIAGGGEGARLVDDVVERPAALGAPAERDDAVGACLVAAVDDRQPGRDGRAARHGPVRDRGRAGAGQVVRHPDHGPPDGRGAADGADRGLRRGQPQPIDQLGLLVGSQEEVHRRVASPQPGAIRLAHRAAGQHDPHRGIGGLQLRQLAHPADDLLLGSLADRARVDDDEVGGLEARGLLASGGQQPTRHLLRIAPVHLAAERPEMEPRQGPRLGQVLGEARVVGRGRAARGVRRSGREELQHRQGAGRGRSVGHGCAGEPTTTPEPGIPAATSGGTHSAACASAYDPVSP